MAGTGTTWSGDGYAGAWLNTWSADGYPGISADGYVPQTNPPVTTPIIFPTVYGGRVILTPKRLSETVTVSADFISNLQPSETILSQTVTATVYSGNDPNPSALINGLAVSNGTIVSQSTTGGVLGTIYELKFSVSTSLFQTLVLTGYFAVVPDLP